MTAKKEWGLRVRGLIPIREVEEIIRGMPDPGPGPSLEEIMADAAGAPAAVHDHFLRSYAYNAVHRNETFYRNYLVQILINQLHSGEPIGVGGREWLIFVLATLRRTKKMPTLTRGRPIDTFRGSPERLALHQYLIDHANQSGDLAFHGAGLHLKRSYHHVRKLFYSRAFRRLRIDIKKARQAAKSKVSR